MSTVIYLDVLVAVNIFVTYILLVCTRVVLKTDTKKYGVLVASVLGGASSLIIFWESMPLVLSVAYKLFVGILISYSAFFPKTKKLFLKTGVAFFFVNFIFGGLMYFVEITFNAGNILYINGTVYFDVSVLFLVSMTLICYGLLLLCDYVLKRRTSENTLYNVTIFFRNEEVSLKGFYDTGNHLSDGIEGKPVIIADLNSLAPLFTYSELKYLKHGELYDEVPETLKGFSRIVPCSSVTGEAILKAIVADKLVIADNKMQYETTFFVVGVLKNKLLNDEYNCILNSEIFERGQKRDALKINK